MVLPESALGPLTPTVERYWIEALADLDVSVIAGAAAIDGAGYDNVMVNIGPRVAEIRYRARMPVPVSMWQPWRAWFGSSGGARATFRHTEDNAPLRANATLEAIGGTAVWLCSDYGACTTGEVVHVDGGFHVLGFPQAENL